MRTTSERAAKRVKKLDLVRKLSSPLAVTYNAMKVKDLAAVSILHDPLSVALARQYLQSYSLSGKRCHHLHSFVPFQSLMPRKNAPQLNGLAVYSKHEWTVVTSA